jgi:hypothetical protein
MDDIHEELLPAIPFPPPSCSELRTSATQTDNIRGFETKLSENEGPLKTAFAENQTTLIENRPITSGRDHITENGK